MNRPRRRRGPGWGPELGVLGPRPVVRGGSGAVPKVLIRKFVHLNGDKRNQPTEALLAKECRMRYLPAAKLKRVTCS